MGITIGNSSLVASRTFKDKINQFGLIILFGIFLVFTAAWRMVRLITEEPEEVLSDRKQRMIAEKDKIIK